MTSAVSGSIVLLSEYSVTNIIAKGGYAAFKNHPSMRHIHFMK